MLQQAIGCHGFKIVVTVSVFCLQERFNFLRCTPNPRCLPFTRTGHNRTVHCINHPVRNKNRGGR
jgi:hypothetical protein